MKVYSCGEPCSPTVQPQNLSVPYRQRLTGRQGSLKALMAELGGTGCRKGFVVLLPLCLFTNRAPPIKT